MKREKAEAVSPATHPESTLSSGARPDSPAPSSRTSGWEALPADAAGPPSRSARPMRSGSPRGAFAGCAQGTLALCLRGRLIVLSLRAVTDRGLGWGVEGRGPVRRRGLLLRLPPAF